MESKRMVKAALKANRECFKNNIIDRWHYVHVRRMLHKIRKATCGCPDETAYLIEAARGMRDIHKEEHDVREAKEAKKVRQSQGYKESFARKCWRAWSRWFSQNRKR